MTLRHLPSLVCGLVFGFGLSISQMAVPQKVLGFLDVAGDWDPSLLLVLGGAVCVSILGFQLVGKMSRPVFTTIFERPPAESINAQLLVGAALFGVGWGLAGYCPGPAFVALGRLAPSALLFVATFFAGSWLYRIVSGRFETRNAS